MYEQYSVVRDLIRGNGFCVMRTVYGEKKGGGLSTHHREIVADGLTFDDAHAKAHELRK